MIVVPWQKEVELKRSFQISKPITKCLSIAFKLFKIKSIAENQLHTKILEISHGILSVLCKENQEVG